MSFLAKIGLKSSKNLSKILFFVQNEVKNIFLNKKNAQ
jgi:hypothetical protein